jgi:hypothetical protein
VPSTNRRPNLGHATKIRRAPVVSQTQSPASRAGGGPRRRRAQSRSRAAPKESSFGLARRPKRPLKKSAAARPAAGHREPPWRCGCRSALSSTKASSGARGAAPALTGGRTRRRPAPRRRASRRQKAVGSTPTPRRRNESAAQGSIAANALGRRGAQARGRALPRIFKGSPRGSAFRYRLRRRDSAHRRDARGARTMLLGAQGHRASQMGPHEATRPAGPLRWHGLERKMQTLPRSTESDSEGD